MVNKRTVNIKGDYHQIEHTYKVWCPENNSGWNWLRVDEEELPEYEEESVVQLHSGIINILWVDYPSREIVQDLIIDLIIESGDIWIREIEAEHGLKPGSIVIQSEGIDESDTIKTRGLYSELLTIKGDTESLKKANDMITSELRGKGLVDE